MAVRIRNDGMASSIPILDRPDNRSSRFDQHGNQFVDGIDLEPKPGIRRRGLIVRKRIDFKHEAADGGYVVRRTRAMRFFAHQEAH